MEPHFWVQLPINVENKSNLSQLVLKSLRVSNPTAKESTPKENWCFLGTFPKQGGGVSIPKLYVKFWWPLFLAMKFTFLLLNLAKIQIFSP